MEEGQHKMARSALVALGFLLSTCLSAAEALEPAKASELVTATASGSTTCPIFDRRVLSTGVTQNNFSIPSGFVLVITAFEWQVSGAAAGEGTVALKVETTSTSATVATSTARIDAAGNGGANVQFPNGIAVKRGRMICLDPAFTFTSLVGTVHGFFAVDQ